MIEVSKTKIIIKEAILMNTIIHEIIEKITRDFNNNIEDLMLNSRDILLSPLTNLDNRTLI